MIDHAVVGITSPEPGVYIVTQGGRPICIVPDLDSAELFARLAMIGAGSADLDALLDSRTQSDGCHE